MYSRKSERIAAEAFDSYRDRDLRGFIHKLVDYADNKVSNARTAYLFKLARDSELAEMLGEVSAPDEDAPWYEHCGSFSTYISFSDGDIGCNDWPGIKI